MSTLINYFESPTKSLNMSVNNCEPQIINGRSISPDKNEILECKEKLFVKSAKTKNQEIVKNMEEVLSLVKKKHRDKHKHDTTKKSKHRKHHKSKSNDNVDAHKSQKSPLKENRTNSNKKSKKDYKSAIRTLPDLLSPTKKLLKTADDVSSNAFNPEKKTQEEDTSNSFLQNEIELYDDSGRKLKDQQSTKNDSDSEQKQKVNAFQFLMNARNKSIGGNSPRKDDIQSNNEELDPKRESNKKRKLLFEEWADRKGAKKRKFEEFAREQYIDEQMDKRAIRLKKMIESQSKKGLSDMNSKISKQKTKVQSEKKEIKNAKAKVKDELTKNFENKDGVEKTKNIRRSVRNVEKSLIIDKEIVLNDKEILEKKTNKDTFLDNLNSPIKKRNNLYGYFDKTTPSPTENDNDLRMSTKNDEIEQVEVEVEIVSDDNANTNSETPNEKRKKKLTNQQQKEISNSKICITENKEEVLASTPITSGRPRRSCVGKIRYDLSDYDLDTSSDKNKSKRSKLKGISNKETDIIILDCTLSPINDDKDENINQPRKLAPLFVKNVVKTNVDPEKVKARQNFLMSGIPEKMKIDIAKMKQFEQNYEICNHLFPKYNHVPSWNTDENLHTDLNQFNIIWRNVESDVEDKLNIDSGSKNDSIKNILIVQDKLVSLPPLLNLKPLENKRLLVKEWKSVYDKFPTYKCYNQLREKYRYFSAMDTGVDTRQVTESFVVSTRRNMEFTKIDDSQKDSNMLDNVKPPSSAPNGELLFSDKYKPLVSEQILVNITPVNQLKEFLSSWQYKNKSTRTDESMDSTFDYANDSNSISGLPNSVVLVGPISSGKTNAVFALANELNFNVLEINAGMKRSGKKLLQDLQEATQSHQIRKDLKNSNKILKKSLSVLKKTKENCVNGNSLNFELENNTKMSLILVEDADIVFDNYDQGFVDAIYQLVGTSKRPVVILANDKNCLHLQRLINQNCIEFTYPNGVNISKFITILSLMENCPIHLDDIISLYYYNKMDLRKTILEIQFFIQSGGDRKREVEENSKNNLKSPIKSYFASPNKNKMVSENTLNDFKQEDDLKDDIPGIDKNIKKSYEAKDFYIHKQLFEFFTVSQNIFHKIPFPINFDLLWININEIFKISSVLKINSLKESSENKKANFIENKNKMKNFVDFYDSISLASNINQYRGDCCLVNSIENEISHYLVEGCVGSLLKIEELSYNLFDERPKTVENVSSFVLSSNIHRTKKSTSLDFEPMLRSICRSEKFKSTQKRTGSRYYHYLRNLSSNMNSFSVQLLDDVCSVFVDDSENFIELKSSENKKNNDWLD